MAHEKNTFCPHTHLLVSKVELFMTPIIRERLRVVCMMRVELVPALRMPSQWGNQTNACGIMNLLKGVKRA